MIERIPWIDPDILIDSYNFINKDYSVNNDNNELKRKDIFTLQLNSLKKQKIY